MNAYEHCKVKLEELNEVNEKIVEHSARMVQAIDTKISAIDSEIVISSKSVASILKLYRKKLEKARKIFAPEVEEVKA